MKQIMIWKCLKCNSIQYSNAFEHHKMDICPCDNSGIDLETYGCRMMGKLEILENQNGYFDELLICLREQGYEKYFVELDKLYVTLVGVMFVRNLEKEIIKDYIKEKWQ